MCPGCGQPLPASTGRTGQRPRYHGPACRQRALRARRAATPDRRALLDAVDRAEHALVDLRRLLLDGRPVGPEAVAAELATIATQLRGHPNRPSVAPVETPRAVTEPVRRDEAPELATPLAEEPAPPVTAVAEPSADAEAEDRVAVPPATKPTPRPRRGRRARRLIDTVDLDTVSMERAPDFEVSGRWRVHAQGPDGQVLLGTLRRGGGRLGSKHSWEAHDEEATRVPRGPWRTRHDALIGLLLAHKDRQQ